MKRNKNTYTRQTRTTMEHCGNNASNAKHRVTDKGRSTRLHCIPSPSSPAPNQFEAVASTPGERAQRKRNTAKEKQNQNVTKSV